MTWRYACTCCLIFSLYGCARGVSQPTPLFDAGGGNGGNGANGDSGPDGDRDAMSSMRDAGSKDAGKPNGKDSGMTTKDAGTASKDAGTDAGPVTCTLMNMCSSARVVPQVAGDTGSDMQTATGMRSEWLSVHVSDTTLTGSQLKARIGLTSSGGANYDLFVLKPSDIGGNVDPPSDCAAAPTSSVNASGADTVSLVWDDEGNNLGESAGDGLTLSIEVRHVSGPCGSWNLTVEGNK